MELAEYLRDEHKNVAIQKGSVQQRLERCGVLADSLVNTDFVKQYITAYHLLHVVQSNTKVTR